ncbi:hypothetical protein BH23ACT10_BH23ACT10_37600 [soil metagenome]
MRQLYRTWAIATVIVVVLLAGCTRSGASREAVSADHEWWGRTFTSVAIRDDERPRSLEPGTEIELVFAERDDRRVVLWKAGCYTWAAPVMVGANQLEFGAITQSANGLSTAVGPPGCVAAGVLCCRSDVASRR